MAQPNPYAGIGLTYPRQSKLFPEPLAVQGLRQGSDDSGQSVEQKRDLPVAKPELDLRRLLRFSPVITVLAQVEDRTMSLLGGVSCTLKLSYGSLVIHTHQHMLPYQFCNGSWVRATILLARGEKGYHRLLQAEPVSMEEGDPTTAWLPLTLCARSDHLCRLQVLVSALEPGLQAIFAGALSNSAAHRYFLSRVSAADHHVYPGGLLDHSIESAERLWANQSLAERERGIGALVCLIFDLGKTRDKCLRPDRERLACDLAPHPQTLSQLRHTLEVVELTKAELVRDVRLLLGEIPSAEGYLESKESSALLQCVRQAIVESWKLGDTRMQDALSRLED